MGELELQEVAVGCALESGIRGYQGRALRECSRAPGLSATCGPRYCVSFRLFGSVGRGLEEEEEEE